MKQLILMNKKTGELGLGCRVQLFDNILNEDELGGLPGYSISIRGSDFDGWIFFSGKPENDHPWIWVNRKILDDKCEVIGEL